MVLTMTNLTPWTRTELLERFPFLLTGAEGEGGDGGEGAGPQSQGGDGSGTTTTSGKEDDGSKGDEGQKTFDREYVETLRGENASRRQHEKDLEAELQKYKDAETERAKAEMTEAERAKAEAEEEKKAREAAETALVNERKRNAVISEAAKLKFLDPEDALAYIDVEDIRMTDDGRPHKTSVESAVKKVADEKKYLISGTGSADGGTRGESPKSSDQQMKEIQDDITARGGVPVKA